MLTGVLVVTTLVFTVKVALVRPAATVTLLGTVATEVLLLESDTVTPPVGATPFRVTVPVDVLPPLTVVGFRLVAESDGRVTVRFAFCVAPLNEAEILTEADPETGTVVTAKVALVAPAATVTFAGAEAFAELLLEMVTTEPPAAAGPLRVTVPVEALPPMTDVGLREIDFRASCCRFRFAVLVVPFKDALMVTDVDLVTAAVVMVNVALVAPPATVTLAGTVASETELLDSVTVVPLAGAAALKVTVPVEVLAPVTVVGFRLSADSVEGWIV